MKGLFQVLLSFALLLSVKFVPLIISHDTDGVNRGDVRDEYGGGDTLYF